MDLSPRKTQSAPVDEKLWLASKHGTDCTDTITLDLAGGTFDAILVPGGDGFSYVPSGTAVIRGGDGLYDRVDADDVATGHLFESVRVLRDGSGDATVRAGAALLWHGEVVQARVPATTAGAFGNANRAAAHIRYV